MRNRIDRIFGRLKKERRKALIGYVTAGFPTKPSLKKLAPLLESAGLDLLEIGVPFSDPIADGPTIQYSSQIALENKVTLTWVLSQVRDLRRDGTGLPIILMSYCNPIHAMGIEAFFKKARAAGVDGLIIPDMIPEESDAYSRSAKKNGVALIYLAAPTTPPARLRMIAQRTEGFLYVVSLTGVTGVRTALPAEVSGYIKRAKSLCKKPMAVGFGISTPQQALAMSRDADGVIVGSALIRAIEKSKGASFKGAAVFVRSLAKALNPEKELHHAS